METLELYEDEELEEQCDSLHPYLDELVMFEPVDPAWRIYHVVGSPPEQQNEWLNRASLDDFFNTPRISYERYWEMCFGYDQGTLPPEFFDDRSEFMEKLVAYLHKHFADRHYVLKVSINGTAQSWSRLERDTELADE